MGDPADALAEKVEEISGLISRLEPTLVEQLFARLARSVLALDSDRRQQLLRDTVLPGLLEGRADGRLLRHFPDLELADSLSLLLDLQVAAPEMLRSAFERLELPSDRQARMKPIIDERVAARRRDARATDDLRPGAIDGLADGGIRVEGAGKDFRTFTTFDLSLDPATQAALSNIAAGVDATDLTLAKLACVRDVLAVEANPEVTAGLVTLAGALLGEIESRKDWLAYAALVSSFGALAQSAHEERPEVADQVRVMLAALATSDLCLQLAHLVEASPDSGSHAAAMFAALGPPAGPAIADALGRADDRMRRALVKLAAAQAPALTPALLPALAGADPIVVRHVVQSSRTSDRVWNRRWRRWWRTPTNGWRERPAGPWRGSGRPRRSRRCPRPSHAAGVTTRWPKRRSGDFRRPRRATKRGACWAIATSSGGSRAWHGRCSHDSPRATPVRPPSWQGRWRHCGFTCGGRP